VSVAHRDVQKKLALAYMYSDLLEIYNETGELIKRIHGPDCFYPQLSLADKTKNGNGLIYIKPKEDARSGYCQIAVSDNEIWLQYSGQNYKKEVHSENRTLFVFDWEGNPLRRYVLDHSFFTFTVDAKNKTIYTYRILEEMDKNDIGEFISHKY